MHTASPSPRRRLPRWFKVAIVSLLVVANLVALGTIWLLRTGQQILELADADDEVVEVLDVAEPGAESLVFLIVGSDSREGLTDLTHFGAFGGARSDVVMLMRLDRPSSSAQMLSIPRDLYVEIPGHGRNKINAAYAYGGSSLLVETIRSNLGVEVNHYAEISFVGFMDMVDALGGVEMTFPHPARDTKSGLAVESGTQLLDGKAALAYARSRSYQELQNGQWVGVEANDIGRTGRQQDVIRAIFSKLKQPGSIAEATDVAAAMASHMTIDSRLASSAVGSLAWDFRGVLTGSIEGATLPTYSQNVGGSSVQIADEPAAGTMLANFRSGARLELAAPEG